MGLFDWLSPTAAEAKVNYDSPVLSDIDRGIQQGQGQNVDPAVLQFMQGVLQKAHAIPEVANVQLAAPSSNPRVLGQTYPGDDATAIKIAPRGDTDKPKMGNTLVHELTHFLLNTTSKTYDDSTALRQHAVIGALLSPEKNKEQFVHDYIKQNFPNEDETSRWFKLYKAQTMQQLNNLLGYIKQGK